MSDINSSDRSDRSDNLDTETSDSTLWDRYHGLLHDYITGGDEDKLREVVALSRERGLTLETTSGRIAASVRAVLAAYTSIGAESMVVDVNRGTAPSDEGPHECRVSLRAPEAEGDRIDIEIRGRCSDQDLPIVRLDYVSLGPGATSPKTGSVSTLRQPIEPRQLYEVLRELLT